MSYDPRWLLVGLETIFGEAVPMPTLATSRVDRALGVPGRGLCDVLCVLHCMGSRDGGEPRLSMLPSST